jgi:hypothetical protein
MKLSNTQKTAIYAGGSVALIGAIVGGILLNNHLQAEKSRKAAELAYANRPIVEASCTMNGYGAGECNFTNSGKTAGAKCGTINVNGPGVVQSDKFCSGQVAPMSTEKVEFKIPAVDELCDNGFDDWRDKCDFNFVESGVGGGQTQGA